MSSQKQYNFSDVSDYNYDSNLIEIANNKAALKQLDNRDQVYTEDFLTDDGFTYDPAKAEFIAGEVLQKKSVYADELFAVSASLQNNANADRFQTSGTATATGGATLVTYNNNQYLDISNGTGKYFSYDAANVKFLNIGTIRFKIVPQYSGTPTADRSIYFINTAGSNKSQLSLYHDSPTGNLLYRIYSFGGALVVEANLGPWAAVAGQEYEFEINHDFTAGATRLFIDGVLNHVVITATTTRLDIIDTFNIGFTPWRTQTDYYIRDFQVFNTVQHTTDFTGEIPRYVPNYQASTVELPNLEYIGASEIINLDTFISTENNSPRWIIDNKYWNGAAWAASNGTYAQANTSSDVAANIDQLSVLTSTVGIKLLFDETLLIQSVSNLQIDYFVKKYSTDIPKFSISNVSRFWAQELLTFNSTLIEPGTDAIKFILVVMGVKTYWNGAAWAASNGTYAQSNTLSEVSTNIATLVSSRNQIGLDVFLSSADSTTTPEISLIDFTYDAALPDPERAPRLVDINGFIYDNNGPRPGLEIKVRPYRNGFNNPNDNLGSGFFNCYEWQTLSTTLSDGFFSGSVYLQPTGEYWELKIGKQRYKTQLPDQDAVDFSSLTLELAS